MKPGDVILVKFPFANLEKTKQRPALVLAETAIRNKDSLLTIAMITSQVDGLRLKGDVHLEDWKEASLLHPSLVRLAKIATIDSDLMIKQLGSLAKSDSKLIKRTFQSIFLPWMD